MNYKISQSIRDLKRLAGEYRKLAKNLSRRKDCHEHLPLVDLLTRRDDFLKRGDLLCENTKGHGSCYDCFWDPNGNGNRCHGQPTYKEVTVAKGTQESVKALRKRATYLLKIAKLMEESAV